MKKRMLILVLAGILLFWVAYVYAEGLGFGPGPRGRVGQELWSSLTPDQIAKIKELRRKFEEETAQLRGTMLTKRLELQAIWRNPKADEKALREKERELRELQNQWRDKMLEHRLEVRKLLTPEQLSSIPYRGWMRDPGIGFGKGFRMGYATGPHCRGPY